MRSGESRQSRADSRSENQAARQESRAGTQSSRQQSRSTAQANRLEAYDDNHWDEGTGLAIAGTAALVAGSAAAVSALATTPQPGTVPPEPSQFATAPTTPAPVLAAPCANPTVVQVGDVTYSQCGSVWYTLAYGADGPVYVQSGPPPGS